MNLTLKVWRQKNNSDRGRFETYEVERIFLLKCLFLEMFDVLNERLIHEGKDPIAFDHDCREGNLWHLFNVYQWSSARTMACHTTCQLHMRAFKNGDTIVIEPWRAKAFLL
jgi:succinate dehydrogenase / fumarate reductase iron-sulfur subunit